jgi:hypothetical protein
MRSHQIHRGQLELVRIQNRHEQREVRSTYLLQVGLLPCRPEPRQRWDEQGREMPRVLPPAWQEIEDSRAALRAAVATGDGTVIAGTYARVGAFYDTLKALALAEVDTAAQRPRSIAHAHLALVKETTEAIHAAAVAQHEGTPGAWSRAKQEAREAAVAIAGFVGLAIQHDAMRAVR